MEDKLWLRLAWGSCITAAWYPFFLLLDGLCGVSSAVSVLLLGFVLLCTWAAMWGRILLHTLFRKHPRLAWGLVWLVVAALVVCAVKFAPYPYVLPRALYGIAAGASFFAMTKCVCRSMAQLTHGYVFAGICIWDGFFALVLYLAKISVPMLPMVLILLGNGTVFVLSHNATALGQLLQGREGEAPLPVEIRKSNRHMMTALCLLGTALLCCYKGLAKLLRWVGSWLLKGIWYVVRWILSRGSPAEEAQSVTTEATIQETQLAENNSWVGTLIEAVVFLALVGVLVWKRREIAQFLVQTWQNIRRWVAARFRPFQEELPSSGAYCDYVADLIVAQPMEKVSKKTKHNWNKEYRRYLRMPLGVQRYRRGYGLLLAQLPEELVQPADSPREIQEKLCAFGADESAWEQVTAAYEAVRYGEKTPDAAACEALDGLLKQYKSLFNIWK